MNPEKIETTNTNIEKLQKNVIVLLAQRPLLQSNISKTKKKYESTRGKGHFEFDGVQAIAVVLPTKKIEFSEIRIAALKTAEDVNSIELFAEIKRSFDLHKKIDLMFENGIPAAFQWSKAILAYDRLMNSLDTIKAYDELLKAENGIKEEEPVIEVKQEEKKADPHHDHQNKHKHHKH